MEERHRAHAMKQRHLGDSREGPPAVVEPSPVDNPPPQAPPPRESEPLVASPPRGPSDTHLRERQRAWRLERERFEEAKRRARTAQPPAK